MKKYKVKIKNVTDNTWIRFENENAVHETVSEEEALIFEDEDDVNSLLECLKNASQDCYMVVPIEA